MADLTLAVAQSHQQAPHQTGYSRHAAKLKKRVQSIAKKYDPAQPRDAEGQWTAIAGRAPKDFDKAEYDRLQRGNDTNFAIFDYVQGGAKYMNEHLRAGKVRYDDRRKVELLDEHMQRNKLTEDTTLTRTLATSVVKKLKVGDVYQDDGYISTTKNSSKIDDIRLDIGVDRSWQTVLSIQAPKGLGHIDVNAELGAHGYDHQEEVILPRGTKFEVVSKEPGYLVVKVVQ